MKTNGPKQIKWHKIKKINKFPSNLIDSPYSAYMLLSPNMEFFIDYYKKSWITRRIVNQ